MFRDDKKAFAQDHKTRLIVNDAVYAGYLEAMNESQRFFMILPLIHSEEITDHDMAYYLLNKYLREHEGYVQIKKFWQDHTKAIRQYWVAHKPRTNKSYFHFRLDDYLFMQLLTSIAIKIQIIKASPLVNV